MLDVRRVAVLGAGTMGAGIALVAARAGYEVVLRDIDEALVARGRRTIEAGLAKGVELGKVSAEDRDAALARIATTVEVARAVADADLVIEAVPEDLALKTEVLREAARCLPAASILASNTSSLSISRLAAETDRPARFLGMHFFNPVHVMKLLELVVGRETSEETLAAARAVGARMGKEVITVADSPGFATSRLGVLLGLEAMRMVEQEVASATDIDLAMTLGYGHPMGPLKLTDLVGLDVRLKIAEYLHATLDQHGSTTFEPPALLRRMVAEGKLGQKSGEGFYHWNR